MDSDLATQATIRWAVHYAPNPLPILTYDAENFPPVLTLGFRNPHSYDYVDDNGLVTPPSNVKAVLDEFYRMNIATPHAGSLVRVQNPRPGCSKQELYRLWWLSADQSNLSGVMGNWVVGDAFKLTFDEIVPFADGGSYIMANLQVVTIFDNTAKLDFPNADAVEYFQHFKIRTPTVEKAPPTIQAVVKSIVKKRRKS
jgi:hypothetical protein